MPYRGGRGQGSAVDLLAKLFADFKVGQALGFNGHRPTCARVATCVGSVLASREAAKASDLHALITDYRVRDTLEDLPYDRISCAAWEVVGLGQRFYEI